CDRSFSVLSRPCGSRATTSVNVPPRSIQNCQPARVSLNAGSNASQMTILRTSRRRRNTACRLGPRAERMRTASRRPGARVGVDHSADRSPLLAYGGAFRGIGRRESTMSGRDAARGFVLVELVVVITILGILAAFAVPRFLALQVDARVAAVEALEGRLRSSATLMHALWLARGRPA